MKFRIILTITLMILFGITTGYGEVVKEIDTIKNANQE
jgi:hypothetical protein